MQAVLFTLVNGATTRNLLAKFNMNGSSMQRGIQMLRVVVVQLSNLPFRVLIFLQAAVLQLLAE